MQIFAKVKPNSKEEKLEKLDGDNFLLWVKAPAKENKANIAVIELLSKYFDTPKSAVKIMSGHKSKNKVFNIER